jgi:hypothetical protein
MKRDSADDDPTSGDEIKDFVVLKMKECGQILKKKNYLKEKLSKAKEDKQFVQLQYKELDEEYCKIGRALKNVLQGRLVHTNDFDPIIYEI